MYERCSTFQLLHIIYFIIVCNVQSQVFSIKSWAIVVKVNKIMNAIDNQFLICGSANEVTLCNSVAKKMLIQKVRFWTNNLLHS